MKATYAYDLYLSNPNGGTFWMNQSFSSGYVLALPDNELRVGTACVGQSLFDFYIHSVLDVNADGLGWWYNDKLYLDSVIHVDTLEQATLLGTKYNQLAVYCLDTDTVINLHCR